MDILEVKGVDVRKSMYQWGLVEGYKVSGLYCDFNCTNSCLEGGVPVNVQTSYSRINDNIYTMELIFLPSGRIKKTLEKLI